jgi:hypothetical protein
MAFIALVFKQDFDGHKCGKQELVELSLGKRYIENGIAVPLSVHLDNLARAEAAAKKEVKQAKAEAADEKKADEAKKAELIKARSEDNTEKTVLRKAHKRDK